MTIGKSLESRNILAMCKRLFAPKPIGPRKTDAPASPSSRAFSTIAS